MTYVKPIVPQFTGLKDLERRIQNMQIYIGSNIDWLNYSFGLADRITQQREDPYTFPGAWMSNTADPFDCMPNDNFNFCFWVADDLASLSYNDDYAVRKDGLMEYSVSVIFYVNLKRVSSTNSYNVTRSGCRNEIKNLLDNMTGIDAVFTPDSYIENDFAVIYDGFTVEAIDNIKKQLPNWALRVNGRLSFRTDCDA